MNGDHQATFVVERRPNRLTRSNRQILDKITVQKAPLMVNEVFRVMLSDRWHDGEAELFVGEYSDDFGIMLR